MIENTAATKTILLVGHDPYAVRAALQLGLRVVLVHSPFTDEFGSLVSDWTRAPVPPEVTSVRTEDFTSVERVMMALGRHGIRSSDIDFIHTSSEEALVTTAALARVFDVDFMSADKAILFRDKWLQKRAVSAAGLAAASSVLLEDIRDGIDATTLNFPLVLKPVAGGGTRNTSRVDGAAQLMETLEAYRRRQLPQRTFVAEDYVDGAEWVVEAVVFGGTVRFYCVGAYVRNALEIVSSNGTMSGYRFDPVEDQKVYEDVGPFIERVVQALGMDAGVLHMEIFKERVSGALYFGEAGARRGGGMTEEVVFAKFGVDLGLASIQCAIGIDPEINVRRSGAVVGSTFLPAIPGTIVRYPGLSEVMAQPGVVHARLEAPWGTVFDNESSTILGIGQVVLSGADLAEFQERRDALVAWFVANTEVLPTGASNEELRARQLSIAPFSSDFFPLFKAFDAATESGE